MVENGIEWYGMEWNGMEWNGMAKLSKPREALTNY